MEFFAEKHIIPFHTLDNAVYLWYNTIYKITKTRKALKNQAKTQQTMPDIILLCQT